MAAASAGFADDTTAVRVTQTSHFAQRQQLLTPDIIETVDWHCYSAPGSRGGSFKRSRKTGLMDAAPRSSLPSLEDSITAKLLELQQLEADDCRVVREFVTSEGGIVHRGDSFRRNREITPTEMKKTTTKTSKEKDRQTQSAAATQPSTTEQLADTVACKVVIVGERGVGKTALLQQLMTSHYMAAMNTCSFGQSLISILVNCNITTRGLFRNVKGSRVHILQTYIFKRVLILA